MSFRSTLQPDALKLVARKLQSSLAVEGELPEDGLAAYGDEGDDLMMALARKIVSGDEKEDAETVEEVFAQARDAESEAEELLVDERWRPAKVEPEPAAVNGNGHRSVLGPTIELVPGNGRHEESEEPQRLLFSWAEIIAAEPVRIRDRKRKPQPATASLFEWALSLEQEREVETVGAGR